LKNLINSFIGVPIFLMLALAIGCASPCRFTSLENEPDGYFLQNYKQLECLRDGDEISVKYMDGTERTGTFVELERDQMFVQFDERGAVAVELVSVKQITLTHAAPASKNIRIGILMVAGIVVLVWVTRITSHR